MRKCIPFSFHRNDWSPYRQQHYGATAAWSAALACLGMGIFLGVVGFQKAHDEEQQQYDKLDDSFHRFAAYVTIAAINAGIAVIPAVLHKFIQVKREGLRETDVSHIEYGGLSDSDIDRGGRTLQDKPQVSCFTPTPWKTYVGSFFLSNTVTLITLRLRPEYFQELVESDYAHYGAVFTGAALTALVASGLFTGCHKAGAKIHDCVEIQRIKPVTLQPD